MAPRIKIEDRMPDGSKISITLESRRISEAHLRKIIEFLNSLSSRKEETSREHGDTLSDIIWETIYAKFGPNTSFTSRELRDVLAEEGYNVDLRVVSTYLLRFYRRGLLERSGRKFDMRYRIAPVAAKR